MPRRLKTYVTSSGFFELAVAAPSMKAALEIWGGDRDLFHRGFAKETDDPKIVKATMSKPGQVLQRGVGTSGAFKQDAELPDLAALDKAVRQQPAQKPTAQSKSTSRKTKSVDSRVAREAARRFDLEQQRREREGARVLALEKKNRDRRDRAINKAALALEAGRARHTDRLADIEKERQKWERDSGDEDRRWEQEKQRLETALQRARN
jgi:colicin import membrane protein